LGRQDDLVLGSADHDLLETLAELLLVLDPDDLLVHVPTPERVAVREVEVVGPCRGVDPVEQRPEVVDLVEHRRAGEQEVPRHIQPEHRLGSLALAGLDVVGLVVHGDVEAHVVQRVEMGDHLLVADDQDVGVELSELLVSLLRRAVEHVVREEGHLLDLVRPVPLQGGRRDDEGALGAVDLKRDAGDGQRLKRLAKPHHVGQEKGAHPSEAANAVALVVHELDLGADLLDPVVVERPDGGGHP
jgi:hypothetical protein